MALRDWPARRLGAAWLIGLVAELALIGGLALHGRISEPPEFRAARLGLDSLERQSRAQDDSIARRLRPPLAELSPEQKAAFRAMLRDSLGITWDTRGTETTVHLPPALDTMARRATASLTAGLWSALLVIAALVLPIPVGLLVLTLAWLYIRRPWRRSAPDVAAA